MNIIIAGMTCSGKTTLANFICNSFNDTTTMHEDDYMKDLKDVPHGHGYYLLDLPSAYHLEEFSSDVKMLLTGGKASYPSYDVKNNRRLSKDNFVSSSKINVFEGLHTITALENISGCLKVFMDIPPRICLERRINRDRELYGTCRKDIEKYFNEIIMNIYRTHIANQKEKADIVIEKEGDVKCLLKKLQTYY